MNDGDLSIYLGSAWWPGVVALFVLVHILTIFPNFSSGAMYFLLGVVSMHLAVAVTEMLEAKFTGEE